MNHRWQRITGIAASTLATIAVAGSLSLMSVVGSVPQAQAATPSDEGVSVSTEPWLTFTPAEPSGTGLIFYPGGRVEPESYAPPLQAIASDGYITIVPDMPFGLAVLAPDTADEIIEAFPDIERWVIGGHSLGGAMAAQYTAENEGIDGLALWAAYPPADVDLSAAPIAATSIYASEDGLTSLVEIEASRAQLPPDTVFIEIDGGNHAGFGSYGEQDGDGVATIDPEEQQAQVVAATVELLQQVEAAAS